MNLIQDLRYAFRTFAKSPGRWPRWSSRSAWAWPPTPLFSASSTRCCGVRCRCASLTACIAIGDGTLSWLDYQDLSEGTKYVFENGVAAYFPLVPASIGGNGEPERIWGQSVSGNYWQVAGAQPALGRGFTEEEDRPGGDPVIVLTNGIWQRRFGGDPNILGKKILVNGGPFEVVGVAPPAFDGTLRVLVPEFWVPLGIAGQDHARLARRKAEDAAQRAVADAERPLEAGRDPGRGAGGASTWCKHRINSHSARRTSSSPYR